MHRTKLYIPDEATFTIPMTFVDVMRQTRTSIGNASEHTLTDFWNDERTVFFSEEWIGTTRFQMLRIRPRRYTCCLEL